jgi:phosphoribosylcarboxyaminoimidazole (NCAIR) mutase
MDSMRAGQEMQRHAGRWVQTLASQALARYGYTYESWIAAAHSQPREVMAARAKAILEGLASAGLRPGGPARRP